jgi:Uma2 family endonuclease
VLPLDVAQLARQRFTFAEYLGVEAESSVKHEFLDGVIYAMAGGSPDHAGIAVNVSAALTTALQGQRCRVFSADLRIRVRETGLSTYADVAVICERIELDPEDPKSHTVVNPVVLVEVLNPSTEDYDRGEKLSHYKRIDSLQEVMLIAHDESRVDLWRRVAAHWTQFTFRSGDTVELASLVCRLPVDEIYRNPLAG